MITIPKRYLRIGFVLFALYVAIVILGKLETSVSADQYITGICAGFALAVLYYEAWLN